MPSLTELVFWLGAGNRLIGRTSFCIEPHDQIEAVQVVGGTKNPRLDVIESLAPDLVLANREENRREDVEALLEKGIDVLVTDPSSVADAYEMTARLGQLLGTKERADWLVAETRSEMALRPSNPLLTVFVAVWKKPLMGLGGDSYGNDILAVSGAANVLAELSRYPELALEQLAQRRPQLILLPDEPYRFQDRDRGKFEHIAPARVIDGKLLWWYGPRMPGAIRELRTLFQEMAAR